MNGDHDPLIRHVPSGLICRSAPQDYDVEALQAVCIDGSLAAWPDGEALQAIGCAARCAAFHAVRVCRHRLRAGAIYLRFTYPDPPDARGYGERLIEDAPPPAL